jgi:drug/metabolite transporter (DMT)-like permease
VILLQKFQPVVAILLAWLVLKEPIPKPFLFWGFVCLIGALLISAPDIEKVLKQKYMRKMRYFKWGTMSS